jgi:hypothetical protein
MSNVIIYDPDDTTVPNRVISYLVSVNTPDYDSNFNKLINPDLSLVSSIEQKYWKRDADVVVEMSANEKILINNFLNAKNIREKKYHVLEYNDNNLMKDTWYDTNDGSIYSGKSEEITYAYTNKYILLSKTIKTFYFDGTESSSVTYNYYTDDTKIIEKQE